MLEQWDCRGLWCGLANGLLFSAFLWAGIILTAWLAFR